MGKRSAHNSKMAYVAIVLACFACISLFQNCAEEINYDAYNGDSVDSSSVSSPLPNPPLITSFKFNGQSNNNPSIEVGDSFNIEINVVGSDLVYEWYKDGSRISNTAGKNFGQSSAKSSDQASYRVIVSNDSGSVEKVLNLTVTNPPPAVTPTPAPNPTPTPVALPTITSGLVDVAVAVYGNYTIAPTVIGLSVTYTGGTRVEWYQRTVLSSTYVKLTGETGRTLQRTVPGPSQQILRARLGLYKVRVYNSEGRYVEDVANVTCATALCNSILSGNPGGNPPGGRPGDPNINLQ